MKYIYTILFFALLACSNSEGVEPFSENDEESEENVELDTGIIEGYTPSKSIKFPHSLHIENGIDCKYCHNSTDKSDLPSVNVCKNCHGKKKKTKEKIEEKTPTKTKKTSQPDDSQCLYDRKRHTGLNAEKIPDDWECAKCHY